MRTEQLIDALARDPTPVDAGAARRRFALLLALGPLAALVLMMALLRPRPDLAAAMQLPMFWVKVLWPAVVAVAACVLLDRLAHPGAKLGGSPAAALAPTLLVVLLGAFVLWRAEPDERIALLLGQTFLGLSTFGWVNVGIAAAYMVDYALGSKAFLAFPKRFAPHVIDVLKTNVHAFRVFRHLHVAFVAVWLLQGSFILFAKQALPHKVYLLALPFYSKALWMSFMAFCFTYPQIAKKRGMARQAARLAAEASVPQAPAAQPALGETAAG